MRIFPNPASNWLRVETEATGEVFWRMFNTLGQLVQQGNAPAGTFNVDVQRLITGVYVLEVQSGSLVGAQRVLKK